VASRSRTNAEQFARETGAVQVFESYEALAAEPTVDAIYIATPNHLHMSHSLLCLEHGKAVLCEKPFALDAVQARAIITKAHERSVFCMEAMWTRFIPAIRELVRIVRNGTIGDLRMLRADLGFPFDFKAESRFFDPCLGGGTLLDLGVYPLALAVQLLGKPATIASQAIIGESGVDEHTSITLGYPEQLANISCSFRTLASNDADIMGSRGRVHVQAPLINPQQLTVTRFTTRAPAGTMRRSRTHGLASHIPYTRRVYQFTRGLLAPGPQRIRKTFAGSGIHFEIEEVQHCLAKGQLESEIMPLGDTLTLMEILDRVRECWRR
jgi:predicted dehydrogenase